MKKENSIRLFLGGVTMLVGGSDAVESCFGDYESDCQKLDCLKDFDIAFQNCKLSCNFCKSENENFFQEPSFQKVTIGPPGGVNPHNLVDGCTLDKFEANMGDYIDIVTKSVTRQWRDIISKERQKAIQIRLKDKFKSVVTRFDTEKGAKKCLMAAPPTRLADMIESGTAPCNPRKMSDFCEQAQEFYLKKFMACRHNFALRKTKRICDMIMAKTF